MVSIELDYTVTVHSNIQLLVMSGQAINKSRNIAGKWKWVMVIFLFSDQSSNFQISSDHPQVEIIILPVAYYCDPSLHSMRLNKLFGKPLCWRFIGLYSLIFLIVLKALCSRKLETVQYGLDELATVYQPHAWRELKLCHHSVLLRAHACQNFVLFYVIGESMSWPSFNRGFHTKCN